MEIDYLQVLRTDASGIPMEWTGYQVAARRCYRGQVAFDCGSSLFSLHGGFNAKTGQHSLLEINSTPSHSKNIPLLVGTGDA